MENLDINDLTLEQMGKILQAHKKRCQNQGTVFVLKGKAKMKSSLSETDGQEVVQELQMDEKEEMLKSSGKLCGYRGIDLDPTNSTDGFLSWFSYHQHSLS